MSKKLKKQKQANAVHKKRLTGTNQNGCLRVKFAQHAEKSQRGLVESKRI